jgi:RNA polymerase sigma-70 factor (ECF subfamily)
VSDSSVCSEDGLVTLFVRHLPSPERAGAARADIGLLLSSLPGQLATAWPEVDYPVERYAVNLASAVPADEEDVAAYLETLHLTDLYLADAVSARHPGAAEVFVRAFGPEIERALAAWKLTRPQIDEVWQRLSQRLTCGDDAGGTQPALASYRGRGPLRAWLRITALREGQRLRGEARREAPLHDSAEEPGIDSADPELRYLKQHYRDAFERAFRDAMTALQSRQRNVLRYFYLEGLRTEEIGRLYGVHRVSVSRWLAEIREQLYDQTVRGLSSELGAGDETVQSLIRLLETQIDVRVSAFLLDTSTK